MYLSVCGLESPCSSFVTYRQVIRSTLFVQVCATSAFLLLSLIFIFCLIIFTKFTGFWAREQRWLNYLKDIIKQSITSTSLLRSVPVRCQYYTHCSISLLSIYQLTRLVSEFRMKREHTLPMMEEQRNYNIKLINKFVDMTMVENLSLKVKKCICIYIYFNIFHIF